ncbi:hypothetical protein Tco_0901123 [Tanacetum coccineum]
MFLANQNAAKRSKKSGSSSFNTESRDAIINLNVDAANDDEDDVDGLRVGNANHKCHGNEERRTCNFFGDQIEGGGMS